MGIFSNLLSSAGETVRKLKESVDAIRGNASEKGSDETHQAEHAGRRRQKTEAQIRAELQAGYKAALPDPRNTIKKNIPGSHSSSRQQHDLGDAVFESEISVTTYRTVRRAARSKKPLRNGVTCCYYDVRGENPLTGRRKKAVVLADSWDSPEDIQNQSGLLPPYETHAVAASPLTDGQIKYARQLGIALPEDACREDVSVFITRVEEDRPLRQPPLPDEMVHWLVQKGIFVPAYAGAREAAILYLRHLTPDEQAAYFCMRVHSELRGEHHYYLEEASSAERDAFLEFGTRYGSDPKFVESLLFYDLPSYPFQTTDLIADDGRPLNHRRKAYTTALAFLRSKGLVP